MNATLFTILQKFTLFVFLFVGTGFIAGSIVHFGEGVTLWDTAVLVLGILLFIIGSYFQESNTQQWKLHTFLLFILQSLLLAIGIGMTSGGTQHFIDTPAYSAILIPLGLCIGLLAFFWREGLQKPIRFWMISIPSIFILGCILWFSLVQFNQLLPDQLREGHGSHGHHDSHTTNNVTQAEKDMADMMGITVEELRNQTPEEHMQAMEAMMQTRTSTTDVEGFLPGTGVDVSTLPEVQPTQTITVANGDTIELTPTLVRKTLNGKQFAMYGYNGQVPGPIIRVTQAAEFTVNVTNNIDMETTIHWHGLRLNNAYDGVPGLTQPAILPGESYSYTVTVPDEGLYWYHPHVREDIQQDMGLYGNIFVEPTDATAYNPVNQEEVLVLDDLLLDASGMPIAYGTNGTQHNGADDVNYALMGRFGNTILVNGEPNYSLNVDAGSVVRLLLTNVANTRTFRVGIPNAQMKLVGSDIGRYEREEWREFVTLAPAERAIVEVYFAESGTYELVHQSPQRSVNLGTITVSTTAVTENYAQSFTALRAYEDVTADINTYREYFNKPVDKELQLTIEMQGAMAGMDHGHMNHGTDGIEWEDTMPQMNEMMRNDELNWNLVDTATGKKNMDIHWQFAKGDIVKVRIVNDAHSAHPMQHPIHFHGQRFLVLNVDGKPTENFVWKDTTMVPTGSTAEILIEMTNPGEWMFHCHIAEHLSNGMMGMFTVTP